MNKSTDFFLKDRYQPKSHTSSKYTSLSKGITTASMDRGCSTATHSKHIPSNQTQLKNNPLGKFLQKSGRKPTTAFEGKGHRRYQSIDREKSKSSEKYRSTIGTSGLRRQSRRNTLKESQMWVSKDLKFKLLMTSLEEEFLESYKQSNYQKASESKLFFKAVLIKIMNYSIDFKMKKLFIRSIKRLGDFFLLCCDYNSALFYYNQTRQCAILLNEHCILIESLISMAICCRKSENIQESILILKKGIEISWYFQQQQLELRIYDEIGKSYYLLGNLETATSYHERFVSAVPEGLDTPQRFLSNQRIQKLFQKFKIYHQICLLFLVHFKLPILKTSELAQAQQKQEQNPLRNQLQIDSTNYKGNFQNIKAQITKILSEQFFTNESQNLDLVIKHDSFVQQPKRKFNFIDFKLNQHLNELGIKKSVKVDVRVEGVKYKESLDEKVKRKMVEPAMDPHWQEKMIGQIKRDRKNKLFKIQSVIRVRGKNKIIKPENQEVRKLFTEFYEERRT